MLARGRDISIPRAPGRSGSLLQPQGRRQWVTLSLMLFVASWLNKTFAVGSDLRCVVVLNGVPAEMLQGSKTSPPIKVNLCLSLARDDKWKTLKSPESASVTSALDNSLFLFHFQFFPVKRSGVGASKFFNITSSFPHPNEGENAEM